MANSSLQRAVLRIRDFEQGSLTKRLSNLEALFARADRHRAADLCRSQRLDGGLINAGIDLKKLAGQVSVLLHAVGILAALPHILRGSEKVKTLSLGAGNTGRPFDLETTRRVAEFKFIRWRGGSESIRQNSLFKDFYYLAEARTSKRRVLYLLELERPLKFLNGGRSVVSVMSRNNALLQEFQERYRHRFRVVRDYYQYRRGRVRLVNLSTLLPALRLEGLPTETGGEFD